MDFSTAESKGFTRAYIRARRPDAVSLPAKDQEALAQKAMRGCEEHFAASVTRLKKQGAIIPPDQAESFYHRAMGLIHIADTAKWEDECKSLVQDFPILEGWLSWWC